MVHSFHQVTLKKQGHRFVFNFGMGTLSSKLGKCQIIELLNIVSNNRRQEPQADRVSERPLEFQTATLLLCYFSPW